MTPQNVSNNPKTSEVVGERRLSKPAAANGIWRLEIPPEARPELKSHCTIRYRHPVAGSKTSHQIYVPSCWSLMSNSIHHRSPKPVVDSWSSSTTSDDFASYWRRFTLGIRKIMEELFSKVLQVTVRWRDCEERCARLFNRPQRRRHRSINHYKQHKYPSLSHTTDSIQPKLCSYCENVICRTVGIIFFNITVVLVLVYNPTVAVTHPSLMSRL